MVNDKRVLTEEELVKLIQNRALKELMIKWLILKKEMLENIRKKNLDECLSSKDRGLALTS